MEHGVVQKRFSFASELEQYQYMIDRSARRLDALRSLDTTTSTTVQQEVRELEAKLIRLFGRQLALLNSIGSESLDTDFELQQYPKFRLWLEVVGLQQKTIEMLMLHDLDVRSLKNMCRQQVEEIISKCGGDEEDRRCLVTALEKLKMYSETLERGDTTTGKEILYWDSYRNTDGVRSAVSRLMSYQNSIEVSPPCSPGVVSKSPPGTRRQQNSPSPMPTNRTHSPTPPYSGSASTTPVSSTPPSTPGSTRHFLITLGSSGPTRRARSQDDRFMNSTSSASVSKSGSASNLVFRTERGSMERRRNRSCDALLETSVRNTVESGSICSTTSRTTDKQSKSKIKSFAKKVASLKRSDPVYTVKGLLEEDAFPLPSSPVGMRHSIEHRFRSKMFLGSQECDFCHKVMVRGKKCSECKFKCHKKCERHVPSSCGLPAGYEKFFKMQILQSEPFSGTHFSQRQSPKLGCHSPVTKHTEKKRTISSISSPIAAVNYEEPKSTLPSSLSHSDLLDRIHDNSRLSPQTARRYPQTSGSSSTPPSPLSPISYSSSSPNSPMIAVGDLQTTQRELQPMPFRFPSVSATTDDLLGDKFQIPQLLVHRPLLAQSKNAHSRSVDQLDGVETNKETSEEVNAQEQQQHNTLETEELEHTLQNKSDIQDQEEDADGNYTESYDTFVADCVDSYNSEVSAESPLDAFRMSNSRLHRGSLLSEWEIPYNELKFDRLIAKGKMGDVYRAKWHGDVCVKMVPWTNPTNEQLAQFKFEVTILKKTRHENVVLFMGACLTPPHLAIVTSFIHGETLYRLIHDNEEHFTSDSVLRVAMEIVRGMGYLHARSIVHKDLRSKNVFLEKGRVVITDFGLSPVMHTEKAKSRPGYLRIPRGRLCYLPPEIVVLLKPTPRGLNCFWRSRASDVFAFGVLWYELLAGKWPYSRQRAERTIYQIGACLKPSLSALSITQSTKNLFAKCWAQDPKKRPTFSDLYLLMDKLPKKRLQRSPSYPTRLPQSHTDISF